MQLLVHRLNEFLLGHSRRPLFPRLEHDGRVIHIERRVIGRASDRPTVPNTLSTSGNDADDAVLFLHELGGLRDRDAGQSRRHVERRAFEKGWHELAAQFVARGE